MSSLAIPYLLTISYMANVFSRLCGFHMLTYLLVIVGALNWGLVSVGWFFQIDLNIVNLMLGTWPIVENAVYLLVGLSAIAMVFQSSCDYCTEEII